MNIFGQALSDFYHHRPKGTFYICDESGEHPLDLAIFFDSKPNDHESEILAHVKGKVLDIGCGAGRIMKYLQQHGHDVIGFDIDDVVVQLCKEQGIENVFVESYVNMQRLGIFDTLLLLNRSIGMAGNLEGIKLLLEKCHSCCATNGILIFDSLEVQPELARERPGVFETRLRYKYNDRYSEWFPWVHIGRGVADKLLSNIGWSQKKIVKREDNYCMMCIKT